MRRATSPQIVLRRYNLVELYDDQPAVALWQLREVLVSGRGGSDELYAIAELTYLYAENHQSRPYALAAALYAYAYLFPDDRGRTAGGGRPALSLGVRHLRRRAHAGVSRRPGPMPCS